MRSLLDAVTLCLWFRREAHYVAEAIAETGLLGSMDLVEVNPQVNERTPALFGVW